MSDNHVHEDAEQQTANAKEPATQEREAFIYVTDFNPARQEGEALLPGKVLSTSSFSTVDFRSKDGPPHVEVSERSEGTCRWIHVPVNDADIARKCAKILISESASQRLHDMWMQKLRPAIPNSAVKIPNHAWSMEPSVQMHPLPQARDEQQSSDIIPDFALFLPYLNWQQYNKIKYKAFDEPSDPDVWHERRTLDEFYHSGLQSTQRRNAGQTASKWTGTGANMQTLWQWESEQKPMPEHGWSRAVEDSLVIMVDQVWIWALDEYTLISCFPTSEPLRDETASYPVDLDVMASAITGADLESCQDIIDLLALIAHHSINRMFEESKSGFVDMLSIYRWAAANKAARHTELLEDFSNRQRRNITGDRADEGKEELNLILEVVDILDELNILMLLFEKQAGVVSDLQRKCSTVKPREKQQAPIPFQNIHFERPMGDITINTNSVQTLEGINLETTSLLLGGYAGDLMEKASGRLKAEISDTERLRGEVSQTHGLLLELLDLEQKAASLGEARVTTKQGQAVMLFTVVTIIFLPLSFFTSYFGQNVVEFTGDDKNPKASEVWKVGAPISVVVIVMALVIAFSIMSSWARSKVTRAINLIRRMIIRAVSVVRFIFFGGRRRHVEFRGDTTVLFQYGVGVGSRRS